MEFEVFCQFGLNLDKMKLDATVNINVAFKAAFFKICYMQRTSQYVVFLEHQAYLMYGDLRFCGLQSHGIQL